MWSPMRRWVQGLKLAVLSTRSLSRVQKHTQTSNSQVKLFEGTHGASNYQIPMTGVLKGQTLTMDGDYTIQLVCVHYKM